MTPPPVLLAIDIGNTRTKAGRYEAGHLVAVWHLDTSRLSEELGEALAEVAPGTRLQIGWINVSGSVDLAALPVWTRFEVPPVWVEIHAFSPMPVRNAYQTPHTLGTDRIVAVVGACVQAPGQAVLVIDAGTALTYDVADATGTYLGGAISPGLMMRFRALHQFTARLPEVSPVADPPLIGDSTVSCIQAGVVGGIRAEVEAMIRQYQTWADGRLTVFLTGGDAQHFENHLKNINFADANLVLHGIHAILTRYYPL
ncbi:MAG: type III pantothenate kinase [Bacteroidia bacterium]|nr:type III pantothenate kinase [Bacteroidia bacterium]